ncbi:hypothetical protein ACHAXR_008611 [Thalassiosira sp. AJA248-18]
MTKSSFKHYAALLAADSLYLMMEQECTAYATHDYLCEEQEDIRSNHSKTTPDGSKVTPDDRNKIVDWCYGVVDQCDFDRDTVAIAMNVVDRFMSLPSSCDILYDRVQYQLVAVTALYISIKLNEQEILGIDCCSELSQGVYSVEVIEEMELRIFGRLSWRLNPPTAKQTSHQIIALLPQEAVKTMAKDTWDFIRDEVAFQVENSIRYHYFTTQRPSTIAVAALLNAIEHVKDKYSEDIIRSLVPILKQFDFDSPLVVLATKEQLHSLIYEEF